MTLAHFQTQMGRISERWKGVYVASLIELVWREVRDFSDAWFTRTVDDLIGCCRQAPLLPDFRERIAIERERGTDRARDGHAKAAEDTWEGMQIQDEERREIIQAILRRSLGGMPDAEWEPFQKSLKGLGKT